MAVQIGAKPDSGFNDPIGMLKDCHRRIEHFLAILVSVAGKAQGRVLNSEEQSAVEAALHYFNESGPRHTKDEEESLFPRLKGMDAEQLLARVQRLETEHGEAETIHKEVEQLYAKWIVECSLSCDESVWLVAITRKLQQLYEEHIKIEEDLVFPFAADRLDNETVAEMGSEFKARREKG
jgi:hemerythrin-like domain-containing protein